MEHTESESYQGVAIIKVYFQPNVKVELALAQITSVVQTILRVLPRGVVPAICDQVRRVVRADRAARAERAGSQRG